MRKPWRRLANRGDTIIEVMLAISIFALVLVVSLTSANRSLHSGTDATNRDQALTLAQQQVEFIKNALGTDLQTLQSYINAPATFCINPSTGAVQDASASNNPCNKIGGSDYDLAITHSTGSDSTTVFKVTTSWPSSVSSGTDSLYVYYKVPQAGPNPPVISCNYNVTYTSQNAPGAVTLSGTVDPNGKDTNWHFAYGTTPSLGTNVPVPDGLVTASSGPTNVSENINGLAGGSYYFTLIGTNADGTSNCGSLGLFTINSPPPQPTVTLTSVTHNLSNDTYHVLGQVNPNGTANTHPYMSIGRTCDSGGDADNPASRFNSALNAYENPKGPFSDSTSHTERADMQDTQFSFFFCGHNNPYKFQQCAWWGTDISTWAANHICSNEIDLYQGSAGCTSNCGGPPSSGSTPSCTASWGGIVNQGAEAYSDLFGSCSNAAYWTYTATVTITAIGIRNNYQCGQYTLTQSTGSFYYPTADERVDLSGYVSGYASGNPNPFNSPTVTRTFFIRNTGRQPC